MELCLRRLRGLTKLILPAKLKSIGASAFDFCNAVDTIAFPESLQEIQLFAFEFCTSLKSVTLPEGLTSLGDGAFMCCDNLKSVSLPSTLEMVGPMAFVSDYNLASIRCAATVPPVCGMNAFADVPTDTCVLTVPAGTKTAYSEAATWKDFLNIQEAEVDGINAASKASVKVETSRFNLAGQSVGTATKGIAIVKYSDGSTVKSVVK